MSRIVVAFIISFITSFGLSLGTLRFLKVFKFGQAIREDGPPSHYAKAGTPTMGGIAIILTILILGLIIFLKINPQVKYLLLLDLLVGFSGIGLLDDILKHLRNKNQGLLVWQKLVLQILGATAFGAALIFLGHHQTVFGILKLLHFDNPWLYFSLVVFMILAASNAINLTDGLDGLAAGCVGISFIGFGIISYKYGLMNAALFSAVAAGATLAFLPFNCNPAKVFMGDIGSLGLGAALAGIAILAHQELLLLLIGGVFVAEVLSVILQIIIFKITGRRIFKMSPLHHHFELSGYLESRVVAGFWIAALILCIIGIMAA